MIISTFATYSTVSINNIVFQFIRYIPDHEELEVLRDRMEHLFNKYGDDVMVEKDDDGNTLHVYFNIGIHEGRKRYECSNCGSGFHVEEGIPEEIEQLEYKLEYENENQ